MAKIFSIFALIICSRLVFATTGSDLKQARDIDSDFFSGYVTGVLEAGQGEWWCPKGVVAKDDLLGIVSRYMNEHPEKLNQNAGFVIIPPVVAAYPCLNK
ncbi:MAG: Rap1a/Tai family immunity protein [Methylomonas sp.]